MTPAEEKAQVEFLIDFWDELVAVRPEFGRLSTERRKKVRGSSIAGTALSVYGMIFVANLLYQHGIDPATVLPRLNKQMTIGGKKTDYFSYDNPVWVRIGVLTLAEDKEGNERKQLRVSFPSRRAMADELRRKLNMDDEISAA